jgi:hypothetical protein
MPGQNGVGLHDGGHLSQGLPPELSPKLGQRLPVASAQPHAACNLLAQDTVFCDQVFVANQEFLVYRARDVGQQLLPIHVCPTSAPVASLAREYGASPGGSQGQEQAVEGPQTL